MIHGSGLSLQTKFALTAVGVCLASLAISQTGVSHGIDISSLDRSVVIHNSTDLCQFANAKWLKRNQIPPDRSFVTRYGVLFYKMLGELDTVANKASHGRFPSGDHSTDLVVRFYRTAIDEEKANRLGAAPLKAEFERIDRIKNKEDLMAEFARFGGFPSGGGFQAGPTPDDLDNRHMIFALGMGGLNLGSVNSYLGTDEKSRKLQGARRECYTRMLRLAHQFHADEQADSTIKLETLLARGSSTPIELRDMASNYHRMSIPALVKLSPGVPWDGFFGDLGIAPKIVNVQQPRFFSAFAETVRTVPLSTWRSYLRVSLLVSTSVYLSKGFMDCYAIWDSAAYGVVKEAPRKDVVASIMDKLIGFPIGKLYVKTYFTPEAKARALQMTKNIKQAFRDDIKNVDWMSPTTKALAIKKVDAMGLKLGYPDKWPDYSGLHFKDDSFAQNAIRAMDFEWKRQLVALDKPIRADGPGMTPQTVNGYYDQHRNTIQVTAGWLQPGYFDLQADDASNYGAIGAIIGHEMTHGFDDRGSLFDAYGQRSNWWTKEDRKLFQVKADQIVAQYDNCVSPEGFKVNGKLTLSENIADIGGLAVAYAAYRKSLHGVEPPLKDGFTGDQRFFIAFAQNSAALHTKEDAKDRIEGDWHAPDAVRGTAAIADQAAFYKAFGLPVPPNLPHIW